MQIIPPVVVKLNIKLHGHWTREEGENRDRCSLGLLDVADWGILEKANIIVRAWEKYL